MPVRFSRGPIRLPLAVIALSLCPLCPPATAAAISGNARFEKIAGWPSAGYVELYETDLFLSPAANTMTGPSRRLGAPPGQPPRGDGYYSISGLPAGSYSILVDQPDFFVSPKVIHDINLTATETRTININLDVDYSTWFTADQQWTPWQWDWTQTFRATGTSVTGFSFRLAGTTPGSPALINFREDNGSPNPELWTLIASKRKNSVGSNTDNWLRFRSGEIPMTPGRNYAVQVHVEGGFAPYKRNKDSLSYAFGNGYDENGRRTDYDLNYTVFVDKSDTLVTLNKRDHEPKLGLLDNNGFATRWGQSFVAQGSSLAAADVFAAGASTWDLPFTWTVRQGGPTGPQVGPAKTTAAAYFTPQVGLHGVSYSPGEIPLTPGQTYYIEFTNPSGFNPYLMPPADAYPFGHAFQAGSPRTTSDLSMTLLEYRPIPEPAPTLLAAAALPFFLRRPPRLRSERNLYPSFSLPERNHSTGHRTCLGAGCQGGLPLWCRLQLSLLWCRLQPASSRQAEDPFCGAGFSLLPFPLLRSRQGEEPFMVHALACVLSPLHTRPYSGERVRLRKPRPPRAPAPVTEAPSWHGRLAHAPPTPHKKILTKSKFLSNKITSRAYYAQGGVCSP